MTHYDALETRDPARRAEDEARALGALIAHAREQADGVTRHLADREISRQVDRAELATLPVLRKSDLGAAQKAHPPFGGFVAARTHHAFQSPGPIYEPGGTGADWYRMGRFLYAAGLNHDDLVQNCFSYHMTPAGMMFENGAASVGARVFPAGTGQTELQAEAMVHLGVTAYAGTPDYLKVILDKASELGLSPRVTRAVVGGGALFPSLRAEYADRGITCTQCYATADLGNIAYESAGPDGAAPEGMIVDEGVIVEIVRPGTGDPVAEGEVGEVVVTTLNRDYPLIRFATGDLSAVLPGVSACGRTNMRIKGWMGRADQTAKVKGMFIRPEQVAALVARHPEVARARVVVTRADESDRMQVRVESDGVDADAVAASVREVMKLGGEVEIVAPGSLPNDGKVIDDQRSYD
ncbi:phenylacetate--CoA ligase family protein [Roseobacter sp. HKCCA0434]|uniref:phenylacetate--CoA ligase family protein n=1 Tax=Roseobacter sp. HKCCA0434 TaxID=3079297 RepID=UPI00290588E9|nr:AMP-binding protein [Roseobacter sp. HKCCA0434]